MMKNEEEKDIYDDAPMATDDAADAGVKPTDGEKAVKGSERRRRNKERARRKTGKIKHILLGDVLKESYIINEIPYIIFVTILFILYIANRYHVQQQVLKIDKLKLELVQVKYDAVSKSSELLVRTRQSRIMQYLKNTSDSTLQTTTSPPYVIKKD